ncbi:hypothetical protein SPD48_17750 [Pseudogracilibacillus sp. SE30717A]|uniref:hypothetical protein n=1 Tax=Pseudogracilibacillus sp. SE30717A TaxID=3098293 RepID=UPI00300E6B93
MIKTKFGRKGFKKMIITTTVLIGASTLLSLGISQVITAAELKNTNIVPTNYANYTLDSNQTEGVSLPKGYKHANYSVGDIDLEYYRNQTPTSKDMSKEEAAEIGAQVLWDIFDVNLEKQVIEMGYERASDSLPRSTWYGEAIINGKLSYYFSVDSVTGEVFSIGRGDRTLDEDVSVEFDAELDKNPQEFVTVVKELAEKYNVVHGSVKLVDYNGQGYSNNDPTISFDITGENGEIALMTLSRYDKELLGISYSASYKPFLEYSEQENRKLQERIKDLEKSAPQTDENEESILKVIDLD